LVIGGGIQGAAIAREAALRDSSVLMVEQRDFASGTSSRSSRLIHGGLQDLWAGRFSLVREALAERERLLRLNPHLVRPAPMMLPFFHDGVGSRRWSWLGVNVYSWLATRSTMPKPRKLKPGQAVAAFPGLRTEGLRGGLVYFDAVTADARLTLANVQAAALAGATVVNHCTVVGVAGSGSLILRDAIGEVEVRVRARHVVNAAGPRVDHVRRQLGVEGEPLVRTSRGSHLVLAPRSGETAITAFLPDGRMHFVVPHSDGTVCGTTDVDAAVHGDEDATVTQDDLRYLLDALGFLLVPPPRRQDIRFAYSSWRSLPTEKGPRGALNREGFLVQEPLPSGTLHTVVGGKLTTHRAFAERATAQILGVGVDDSPTRTLSLPGGAGPREVTDPLWWRHGDHAGDLRRLIQQDAGLAMPLCPHRPLLEVEAVYALRNLGAVTFSDLMLRRLIHAQGPCMQRECLRAAHSLFFRERIWPVDDDFTVAARRLVAEVRQLTGGVLEMASPAAST